MHVGYTHGLILGYRMMCRPIVLYCVNKSASLSCLLAGINAKLDRSINFWAVASFRNRDATVFVEVTIGNCFPEVGEILPDAEGFPQFPQLRGNNQRANNDVMDA